MPEPDFVLRRRAEPRQNNPPDALTARVTLNPRDARVIRELREEHYRTPARQVGRLVAQCLKQHGATHRASTAAPPGFAGGSPAPTSAAPSAGAPPHSNGSAVPSSAPPALAPAPGTPAPIPVYHIGDGSAGSGCGRVGLFFTRPIGEGSTIGPGDVLLLDGTPLVAGGLVCGHCGGPFTMAPRNWRTGLE